MSTDPATVAAALSPAERRDLAFIGENADMGDPVREHELADGGASLIASGLAEKRHGRLRLTLDGLDVLVELRRDSPVSNVPQFGTRGAIRL